VAAAAAVQQRWAVMRQRRQAVLAVMVTMFRHLLAVPLSLSVLVAVAVARQVVQAAHLVLVVLAVLMRTVRRLVLTRHQVVAVAATQEQTTAMAVAAALASSM
jgi:hypothetical protein